MKHGPIALIDENMPAVVIALRDSVYDKVINNIQEIKARRGRVIAIVTEGDRDTCRLADHCIEIPHVPGRSRPAFDRAPAAPGVSHGRAAGL